MKVKMALFLGLSIVGFSSCFAKFYTIKTEVELKNKIKEFVIIFAAFAKDKQNDTGKYVQEIMRKLSQDGDFDEESGNELKFGFLFVDIDDVRLKEFAQKLGYKDTPIFTLYDSGKFVASTDFVNPKNNQHYYTIRGFKKFIEDSVGKAIYDPKIDDAQEREDTVTIA